MLRPVWLVLKANIKVETKNPLIFLAGLTVPLIYPVVFSTQIYITYRINSSPFSDLPLGSYLSTLLAIQIVFWLSMDRSMRYLTLDVLSSDLDLILTKPISFFL